MTCRWTARHPNATAVVIPLPPPAASAVGFARALTEFDAALARLVQVNAALQRSLRHPTVLQALALASAPSIARAGAREASGRDSIAPSHPPSTGLVEEKIPARPCVIRPSAGSGDLAG